MLFHWLIWSKGDLGALALPSPSGLLCPIFTSKAAAEHFLMYLDNRPDSNISRRDFEVSIGIPPEGLMKFADDYAKTFKIYAIDPPHQAGRTYEYWHFWRLKERAAVRLAYEFAVEANGPPPGERVHMRW